MNPPKSKFIICTHHFNNYSGSPFVLRQVVEAVAPTYRIKLLIGNKTGKGFLTGLPVDCSYSFYRFKENKLLRLFFVMASQFHLFCKVLVKVRKKECALIYANTLYSFGPAWAGKLKGIKVVYHIHEISLKPPLLKRFLVWVAKRTASQSLFVSQTHLNMVQIPGVKANVVYNSLDAGFYQKAMSATYLIKSPFEVLMVCSLKTYKGVLEYLEVARKLELHPNITFKLVVNADKTAINEYFKGITLPVNLTIYENQSDLTPFYSASHLVLNLSRPDEWVETFGLTLLEAMTFGIPVIAPPVGGPTELVNEGENGFLISCYETDRIAQKIIELSENPDLCMRLSGNAREKAKQFSPAIFQKKIIEIVNE